MNKKKTAKKNILKAEKIKLKMPVVFEGEEFKEVEWNELLGKDMIQAEREMTADKVQGAGIIEVSFYMIARAIKKPVEFVEILNAKDVSNFIGRVNDVNDFL